MEEPIIEIKNISKKYGIGHNRKGYVALRDVLTDILKHPFSFMKKKVATAIQHSSSKEDFWALRDVSFNVKKGEAIGIIGANGAGKSTLLKILSRITPPTSGEIILRGRVASLLEVGTGFHPELTGRDNIFMNGSILGMTKKEISEKFNDIVEFSGVEKFIDTPVKHYSSGMYVRLAFSIAAHMDPDILIVDEVLAVGDAEFQKKCLGKMDEITNTADRTVLFVSHNMSAIQSLCERAVLLEHGKVKMVGEAEQVIAEYLNTSSIASSEQFIRTRKDRKGKGNVRLTSFSVESQGKPVTSLETGGRYTFCFGYESKDGKDIENVRMASALTMSNGTSLTLLSSKNTSQDFPSLPSKGVIRCEISQKFPFIPGVYQASANLMCNGEIEDLIKNVGVFEVKDGDFYGTKVRDTHSPVYLEQDWSASQ